MASGDSLAWWVSWQGVKDDTSGATNDVRNQHRVIDFDDSTDESVIYQGYLPASYDGGGLTLELWVAATSATSGNVVMDAAIERIQAGSTDIDSDSFAAVNSVTQAVNGTSGVPVIATITFTDGADMDSLAAGEIFRLKVTRDADNGSDTVSGDVELLRLHIKET